MPSKHFGEVRGRVDADAMLALTARASTSPRGAHGQYPRQRVEGTFMADHRVIAGEPPVTCEKPPHHAIAVPAVPDQCAAWLQHSSPLRDHTPVIARKQEEAERREEVDDGVESRGPFCRKPPHVAARVAKRGACAARPSTREQVARQIETVDVEPRFRQQVGVAPLATRDVEYPRTGREAKQLEETPYFPPISREVEDGAVFAQVLGIEVRRPPVAFPGSLFPWSRAQKKTGSRYAPKTVSSAARIS